LTQSKNDKYSLIHVLERFAPESPQLINIEISATEYILTSELFHTASAYGTGSRENLDTKVVFGEGGVCV
jgi:hypothetical protein